MLLKYTSIKKAALGNSIDDNIKLFLEISKHFKIKKKEKEVTFFFKDQSCNTGNLSHRNAFAIQNVTRKKYLQNMNSFKRTEKITLGIMILVRLASIGFYTHNHSSYVMITS